MRLHTSKKRKWNYIGIAFAIPVVGMLIVMAVRGFSPFGKYTMLYSDMYYQYYPFFVGFRKALREGSGLIYTWSVGTGIDYLGLIAYYLASPLNLLSVLVPEKLLLGYYSLLMPVKLGLASMFFAIFLKRLFRRDDMSIALFGSFYALCAWAMGYQWNVMWLDTFALLPLVALGTVALIRDKRFFLYTVTLWLSIFTNYYIGLFTCVFVFLLFFCFEICRWRGLRRFLADLARIGCFSLLAIGMTAILELPALAALQNTQSVVNNFPEGFQLNITDKNTWRGLLDAMRQVAGNLGGGLEPTFKEGLPNIYCGVGSLLLAFLFLTNGEVRLRDKVCSLALLLFFTVSFIIRQLDYIWHGFHFTNMIPYRLSSLFRFVVLYMAYRAFLEREKFRCWQIVLSGVLAAAVLACNDRRGDIVFLTFNLAFMLLYLSALLLGAIRRRPRPVAEEDEEDAEESDEEQEGEEENGELSEPRPVLGGKAVSLLLALVMGAELVVDLVCFGCYFPGNGVTDFPKQARDTAAAVRTMEKREEDTLFYRAEVTHSQTHNDSALNGFDGISAYTSSANLRVTEFMRALGFVAKNTYNRYCYEETSPIANLFLDLKYMLERDGNTLDNNYFNEVYRSGQVSLLENNAYLPLGFLADSTLAQVDFTQSSDPFAFQNELLTAASGVSGGFWHSVPTGNLTITATEGIDLSAKPQSRWCSYEGGDQSGSISFSYTADRTGLLCVQVSFSGRYNFRVFKNGEQVYSEGYYLPQVLSVSQVEPGDVIEVRQSCSAGLKGSMTIRAAILDEELFRKAYDVLSACRLELTDFDSTRVEGRIVCDRDGLLYTSVPWDGNWLAWVDGEPVEPVLVGDCMIALPMTGGTHTVTLRYRSAAFSLGWKVSLICAAVFLAAAGLIYRPRLISVGGKHLKKRGGRK